MRKTIGVLTAILITGCLFPVAQNLRSIIQSHNNYILTGIVETFDALSLKKHIPIEAPLFVEFGVDSCLVAEFNRGNERYAVETYSFLNPKGALGTYFITDLTGSRSFDLGYHARKNDTAVQFVKANAYAFGVDADNVWACGGSAGGHLAIMIALEGEELAGIVAFNPVLECEYIDISPIDLVPADLPSILLMNGDADYTTPVEMAIDFCDIVGGRLVIYAGKPHGFWNYDYANRYFYYKTMLEVLVTLCQY